MTAQQSALPSSARLILFAGLPGVGKTTIARALAERLGAVYLRIDTLEQEILSSGLLAPGTDIGPAGYRLACRLAADNLRLGQRVIIDSVNPLAITRQAYRAVAAEAGVDYLEVEVVCSDAEEHRRRVETRSGDIPGHILPSWRQVIERTYEPWDSQPLVLDTATLGIAAGTTEILRALGMAGGISGDSAEDSAGR
ncbi:AAA family ATPase [Rhodospirillum rubrum]|uniref:Kinase-like n=1 Tax=Rhodospirillum rubrum (strain ATCC 11170 / ATH 1.1.1 / DSM 467 / LMG 4362 / NCIMB 8255 / S1) TaxID=269796 RepID=Q2RUZ5_RHORT|nr:AAA family ATPase [Rhodospirillum rubrum]ABC22050.1 kinase-like [Rhodospirillum rubrum ATCC 11170]AEO47762.1 kinase-like protein [Rhodospirillum rubrum F11]MBK5953633.1 kinase [Rhodospirillum rubrum]QXG81703.1 AAA family ATPase [Rhodospirillum rubrum]HAQ00230.1 kinase [Rhodospirillum rubrum]